jgi:membrane-associated protein
MEAIWEFFRNLHDPDYVIAHWVAWGGVALLAAIVFTETGLMIGFFLPGDTLLFAAGFACAVPAGQFGLPGDDPLLNIWTLNLVLVPAAILGDSVGYAVGRKAGPALFKREDSLLFHKDHLLKARRFYEHHGAKTIVLARFVPIVRTFAPVVAGIGNMEYRTFLFYNVFGGLLWVTGLSLLGYFAGNLIPKSALKYLVVVVFVLSILPGILEFLKARRAGAAKPSPAGPDAPVPPIAEPAVAPIAAPAVAETPAKS